MKSPTICSMKFVYIFLISLLLPTTLKGEERIAMAFYNVGKLYDTIPSNFYNDKNYTPKGKNRWDTTRYNRKVENIVAVIDSMQMPIIALLGVENEAVVRDLVTRSNQDYSYVHRTIDYYDGLDFALLYYGDILYIDRVKSTRYTMVISGEIYGTTISIHLTRVGWGIRTLHSEDYTAPSQINVAWGALSRDDLKRLDMWDALRESELMGHGDTKGDLSWQFKNRIGVTMPEGYNAKSGAYITEWLLTSDRSAPLATLSSNRYYGGYSNHLPLYIYIDRVGCE